MFCRQCGKELEEDARFCAYCGTKAYEAEGHNTSTSSDPSMSPKHQEADPNAAQPQPLAAESVTTADAHGETHDTTGPNVTDETGDSKTAIEAGIEATADQAKTDPTSGTSLKAAVKATRKRSLRKMPTILLVVLALALATSVAYAAYQAYTHVWVPYQAQQQATQGGDGDNATATSEYVDVWVVDSARNTVAASEIETHVGEVSYEVTYSYDEAGKLVEQATSTFGSVPSTAVRTYEYDGLLPTSIVDETQIVAGNEYNGATETTLEYDDQNRCIALSDFVIQEGDGGVRQNFSYDDLGRISSVTSEWVSGDETIDEETLQVSYDANDTEGANPHFSPAQGPSYSQDSELSVSTLRLVFEDAEYDEYGNLTAITSTDSAATSGRTEYTYKKITVKRDEWRPNPWSNPTLGAGDLSSYGQFTYYSLRPERIEQIMTANE